MASAERSSTTTAHHLFTTTANSILSSLSSTHTNTLSSGNDTTIRQNILSARIIRRSVTIHIAIQEILSLPAQDRTRQLNPSIEYLQGATRRMHRALFNRNYQALQLVCDTAQEVLDGMHDSGAVFDVLPEHPPAEIDDLEPTADQQPSRHRSLFRKGSAADQMQGFNTTDTVPTTPWYSCCGLSCADLTPRDRLVLWLYLVMVIASLIAITAVTVDFVQQAINPGSFIRSEQTESLPAPVVTVCLSQRGVPFSRLQLFNYSDAEGRVYVGADPQGKQAERQGAAFEGVVERFWDNPDGEKCTEKLGDFFPFPLQSLNEIVAGRASTRCRPCYRVGSKHLAVSRSTSFQNSSLLSFYTDNYFLQCLKKADGLGKKSATFLHKSLFADAQQTDGATISRLKLAEVMSVSSGEDLSSLRLEEFAKLSSEQLCNIFYFGLFPRRLNTGLGGVNIQYSFDANSERWSTVANTGPYFRQRAKVSFLPEESLQMFVSTNDTTEKGMLRNDVDMVLIGPNTQTYATLRPVTVYETDRYDISSSTSNFLQADVRPLFGYWLVYNIFYNYNRFVRLEYYRESTYPAGQWFVDLTGYATLFTGASLFSLLLLPLLRSMRKREKQRLLKQRPELYVWAKHKKKYEGDGSEDGIGTRGSVMLPGYNV